jgi:hypothetical protein
LIPFVGDIGPVYDGVPVHVYTFINQNVVIVGVLKMVNYVGDGINWFIVAVRASY